MTIGLFILGALSVLVFFGMMGNVLKKIGIPEWVAFSVILALTLGVVLAPFNIGNASLSVSGFLIPLVLLVILTVRIGFSKEILSGAWASLLVAGLSTVFYMWYPSQLEQTFLYTLLLGLGIGLVATLASRQHKSAIYACIGGVLLFEIGLGMYDIAHDASNMYLGSMQSLDIMLIGSVLSILLLQMVGGIAVNREQVEQVKSTQVHNSHMALMTESAADANLEMLDYYKAEGDYSKIYPEDFVVTKSTKDTTPNHIDKKSEQAEDSYLDFKKYYQIGEFAKDDNSTQVVNISPIQDDTPLESNIQNKYDEDLKNKYIGYFGEKK